MTRNRAVGLFSAGILVGGLALALVQRINQPSDLGALGDLGVSAGVEPTDQIAAVRAEYDQRIAALTAEKEALQADKKALEEQAAESRVSPVGDNPSPRDTVEDLRKRNVAAANRRDTMNLIEAGYSVDRIEYLRCRADELATEFRQSQTDQMKKGVWPLDPEKDLALAAALGADPSFALKYEIGDVEYERYLAARKRPTTVDVAEVLGGSVASSVGIVPGDKIVSYNNKRVFNSAQLQVISLARSTDILGELVPITVQRSGQTIQMMVPRGQLGVRPPPPTVQTNLNLPLPLPHAD